MKNYEYNILLKEKLDKIRSDNKDISDLINPLDCKDSYKNLFEIFLSNLRASGVNKELYNKIEKIIVDNDNVQRTDMVQYSMMRKSKKGDENE